MSDPLNAPFNPLRVVVLSELSNRDKGIYYNILANNSAQFYRDSEGRIIANVRLLSENAVSHRQRKVAEREKMEVKDLPFEERLKRLSNIGSLEVQFVGVEPFDYSAFARFSVLIAVNGDVVRPRLRALSWIMRLIEDAYDARFVHEKMDVERDNDPATEEYELDQHLSSFPVFLVRQLSNMVGLKNLVDQTCWDFLYNAERYRSDYLEIEIFLRFLQEFYDQDDLLFFLYVRAVVARTLHISFKRRWAKGESAGRPHKTLWMSFREASLVSKAVFGSSDEQIHRSFLQIVQSQVVGQRTESADTRRIEIAQFLHLAVVAYHQTQHSTGYESSTKQSGNTGSIEKTLEDLAAESGNDHEYYNIPDDDELAGALEADVESAVAGTTSTPRRVQFESSSALPKTAPGYMSPKSSPVKDKRIAGDATAKKKKLVPVSPTSTKARLDDSDQKIEPWGEGGAYDDGNSKGSKTASTSKLSSKSPKSPSPIKTTSAKTSPAKASPTARQKPSSPPFGKPNLGHSQSDSFDQNDEAGADAVPSEEEIYISIQTDRESEFMNVIMSTLTDIAEDIQEGIYEELQNHLRVRLNDAVLTAGEIESPDQFDDIIVKFLQSQEFIDEMVSLRDNTIEYVQSQLEDGHADEDADGTVAGEGADFASL